MADNTTLNTGTGGDVIATDDIGGVKYQRVKNTFGVDGVAIDVSSANPFPVATPDALSTGTLSVVGANVEVVLNGATSVAVQFVPSTVPAFAGTVVFEGTVNGTDYDLLRGYFAGSPGEAYTQVTEALMSGLFRFTVAGIVKFRVRLTTVTLGSVAVTANASQGTSNVFINAPVSILATRRDADTPTALDGAMSAIYSDSQGKLKVSGPLTDTQLRASAVPVSGTVAVSNMVAQGLTDAQLRATAVPVSAASLPLPTGASTETTLAALNTKTPAVGQALMAASSPVVLASNQSSIPVTLTSTTITGTVTVDTELPAAAAIADALANPTAPQVAADTMLFNNTSWDRRRNNYNTTSGDTGAKTTSFNGATLTNFNAKGVAVTVIVGAVTGTTPSMQVFIQISPDGGTTWFTVPGASSAAITATGSTLFTMYPGATPVANSVSAFPLPRTWRLTYVITGTTPSFTLTSVPVAYIN